MAKRPVFIVGDNINNLVIEKEYDFLWYPGFSIGQKQKSIEALHKSFLAENKKYKVLEISTKSNSILGRSLSAFNLMIKDEQGNELSSVESLFQGCKKFKEGGPYRDIINKNSLEAKRDIRLTTSGELIGFEYKGEMWGLEPKTYFYDWIYINTVYRNKELKDKILKYDAFTDIEFNPKKSINNQARAAALYVSLERLGKLKKVIEDKNYYKNLVSESSYEQIKLI